MFQLFDIMPEAVYFGPEIIMTKKQETSGNYSSFKNRSDFTVCLLHMLELFLEYH